MNPGYYHSSQIASLRLAGGRGEDYRFESIRLNAGALPQQPGVFKDEYLYVNKDATGTLLDEDAGYKDYMEFSRSLHNSKIA